MFDETFQVALGHFVVYLTDTNDGIFFRDVRFTVFRFLPGQLHLSFPADSQTGGDGNGHHFILLTMSGQFIRCQIGGAAPGGMDQFFMARMDIM
ncbi:hypothetical protein SDC9_189209 [bioreactor metagenome]|uniref:Uncharacterized protein n=1 Tax=bioreactor metagenome TaxID=1076179 RepID=A0A645HRH9_9ZZZZ